MMDRQIKIVADEAIPFLKGVFEPYAEVVYRPGIKICRADLMDADALIIRTRTRCDENLLEGTRVRFIATATIGDDHIDFPYCDSRGIIVRNAPGCNAGGVTEYVFSALFGLASRRAISLQGATLGIVGVGHVGSMVERMGLALGFKVLKCDPPRAEAEGSYGFCDLDTLLAESNIVTLHVPLDETTRGMADRDFFAKMRPGAFFINAARVRCWRRFRSLALSSSTPGTMSRISILNLWKRPPSQLRTLPDTPIRASRTVRRPR